MFSWLRERRETSGEWQWCQKCQRLTRSWFRNVRWYGELQRRPVCAECLAWKPWDSK